MSYNSPNQSNLVMIWIAKHVETITVFPFRRYDITWMRNHEFELMFGMNDKTSKDIQKNTTEQFMQFIYQEQLIKFYDMSEELNNIHGQR